MKSVQASKKLGEVCESWCGWAPRILFITDARSTLGNLAVIRTGRSLPC